MIKRVKKFVAVILTLALTLGLCVCTTVGASEDAALDISNITLPSNAGAYVNSNTGTKYYDGETICDDNYGTWMQWDAGASGTGVDLTIQLAAMSRVSRIEIYVGADGTWNASRRNSKYSSIPVSGIGLSSYGDNWGLQTSKASEGNYLNGTGALETEVIAKKDISTTCTKADLDVISIDLDSVCDELSFKLSAVSGKYADGVWTAYSSNTDTRMCVAEIVVYGEELTDALRADSAAACTAELNKPSGATNKEEDLLNDDADLKGGEIKRLLVARPGIGDKATELIFRLDGVYNISAFRANEYWQSYKQTDTTFDDVDLYIGNTTGASTEWTQIADGIIFNTATTAGHSENIMCGNTYVTGDSFKMVVNGTNFSDEIAAYSTSNALTDVALYGTKTSTAHGGSAMRLCPVISYVGDAEYDCIAKTAEKIELTPTYSGTVPTVVAAAAYNAAGELIGVALGESGKTITMNIKSGSVVSFIKLFGWDSTDTAAPISTTYTRYGVGV